MMTEVLILYVGVIGSITALYHLRGIGFIGDYLSTIVAILLMYPAVWHVRFRRLPVVFFEKTGAQVLHSLKYFALTALAIFPVFLLLAHVYQTQIFHLRFNPKGFHWSWETAAVQVILVALPEEFFFRGYLQTMLATKFSRRFRLFGLKLFEMPTAVPIACVVFAFSHSVITLRWWQFAIVFPSLAFGWLREKTGGLIAPVLFHALSNLILFQVGSFYR
ncbi:MAG TPA: CPBP family intramembrane glutamic endopeptidase [bacterium]|nr:CPBP family intramembrane glutamic endopeptidase [bacterium]